MGHDHPLRLVIAGGGTGGHVLPALAVLEAFATSGHAVDALWIGSRNGVECDAAARADIRFHPIQTGKLRRYIDTRTPADLARIPIGCAQAWRILNRFRPDVVFSTGGFVSVPTVLAAMRRFPVLTHEQTAILGLATRINLRVADIVAVSYASTAALAQRHHRHVVVTGNPVRSSLQTGDRKRGLAWLGFDTALPVLYVTGGARGASPLNQRIEQLLPELLETCQVVHQAGPAAANHDADRLRARATSWPEPIRRRYKVTEFIGDELPDVYAACDLVLGRAGAGTVAELAFLGKPSILIPLPGAGADEQSRNADLLVSAGGAISLAQADATGERLREVMMSLLSSPERLRNMAENAKSVGFPDAAERLAMTLLDLAAQRRSAPSP
jgi:UDP-N-acetylglucosamine--N-acetylmuramyl-(pentapeptide) pyrophosphoryl-undecaprenol N-acetylglucosamine transferase